MYPITLRLRDIFAIVAEKKVRNAYWTRSLLNRPLTYVYLGHWIQACPTNNDPKFDGKYRVKRSTGIPRSLQTKVDKPESLAPDGSTEDLRNTGVMVNADGDFVIAKPDKAAWELYQEKAKASAAAAAEAVAAEESKALQARGLECPIDKRMFLEPTKTPCCQRTYCNDCISNALIESDFVCPGCATEGVLLDNLTADDEAASKIKAYEAEKAEAKKEKEKLPAGLDVTPVPEVSEVEPRDSSVHREPSPPHQVQEAGSTQSRKRPAEDEPASQGETAKPEPGNVAKRQKADDGQSDATHNDSVKDGVPGNAQANFNGQDMSFNAFGPMQGMPVMPFTAPGFGNEAMSFMNPMAMASANGLPSGMGPGWNPMNMPFNPLQAGMFDQNNGGMPNGFPNMFNGDPLMMFPMPQAGFQGPGSGMNNFSNQQRTTFSQPYSREEDSPYFRQPVNPQRHQARNRRVRPSDYREL
jgi:protein MPE1